MKPAAFPNRRNGSGGTRGGRVIVTYTMGGVEFEEDAELTPERDELLG